MSGGVSTLSPLTGVSAPVATPASSADSSTTANTQAAVSNAPVSFENPRVVQDPVAGYITEYLSANGSQILSQTPNAITVAYLRNGLTATGEPKHPATTA